MMFNAGLVETCVDHRAPAHVSGPLLDLAGPLPLLSFVQGQ